MEIRFPKYPLYKHQKNIWNQFFGDGAKFVLLLWHRRAGKDIFGIQVLTRLAIEKTGTYMYILPQKNQVRTAIFDEYDNDGKRLLDYIPKEIISKIDNLNMTIYIKNSQKKISKIIFTGSDADSKVGGNIKGVVFSEMAICNPNIYYLIEPMLRANKGRCLMITTPRGKNHVYDLYNTYKRDKTGTKYAEIKTIEETVNHFNAPIISKKDFQDAIDSGVPYEVAMQEYMCSFEVALEGAYYKNQIHELEKNIDKRFFTARPNPSLQLYASFDIGGANKDNDECVLWLFQIYNNNIYINECFHSKGQITDYYLDFLDAYANEYKLMTKPTVVLPHDAKRVENTSGRSQIDYVRARHFPVILIQKTDSVLEDIIFVRKYFNRTMWNTSGTMVGLDMLKGYTKKYDRKTMKYDDATPLHNRNSNFADSFRYCVISAMDIIEGRINKETGTSKYM